MRKIPMWGLIMIGVLLLGPMAAHLANRIMMNQGIDPDLRILGVHNTMGYLCFVILPYTICAILLWIVAKRREPDGKGLKGIRLYAAVLSWIVLVNVGGDLLDALLLSKGYDPYYTHKSWRTSWGETIVAFLLPVIYFVVSAIGSEKKKRRMERDG